MRRVRGNQVFVIISRRDWGILKSGGKVSLLRIFDESELHHEFGDRPDDFVVRVKISEVFLNGGY